VLADARLVVIAGVDSPDGQVDLLREYVEQGGQLVIAAGGDFNASAWNAAAWRDGAGILPLPLLPDPIGAVPRAGSEKLQPFQLSYESLAQHALFQLPGMTEQGLRELYGEPFFFHAVAVDTSPAAPAQLGTTVLARFNSASGPPFLVERRLGAGRSLFISSGLTSQWNTLSQSNAVVILDRMMRSLIHSTLPRRNYPGVERIEVPVPNSLRAAHIVLDRPGREGAEETLGTGFLQPDQLGVHLDRPLARGLYRVRIAAEDAKAIASAAPLTPWRYDVTVNGDADESNLQKLEAAAFHPFTVRGWRWLTADELPDLAGVSGGGQDAWWWLALGVLVLTLLEPLIVLVAPRVGF
jgi:hypothetical protein